MPSYVGSHGPEQAPFSPRGIDIRNTPCFSEGERILIANNHMIEQAYVDYGTVEEFFKLNDAMAIVEKKASENFVLMVTELGTKKCFASVE